MTRHIHVHLTNDKETRFVVERKSGEHEWIEVVESKTRQNAEKYAKSFEKKYRVETRITEK